VYGIDVDGPDNAPTESGKRMNAHTRWGRAFMRALWYQHRWYGQERGGKGVRSLRRAAPNGTALQLEWGRRMPAVGVIPAGRAVRVRVARGGKTALRVVQAKGHDDRIYTDDGYAAGRYAVAADRDWA
jgi:hypothetical protein